MAGVSGSSLSGLSSLRSNVPDNLGDGQWLGCEPLPETCALAGELGHGRSGVVRLFQMQQTVNGESSSTGHVVMVRGACKSISKKKSNPEDIRSEVRALLRVSPTPSHPFIAAVHDVHEDSESIHILMELCEGGDVYHRIPDGGFTEEIAATMFRSVATAVAFCHDEGIIHYDIKAENVLLVPSKKESGAELHYDVKLADFGLSVILEDEETEIEIRPLRGSGPFMSPEAITGGIASKAVDIYTLGAMLFEFLTGTIPVKRGPPPPSKWPDTCQASQEARRLTVQMMAVEANQRPTAVEILASEWVQRAKQVAIPASALPLQSRQ